LPKKNKSGGVKMKSYNNINLIGRSIKDVNLNQVGDNNNRATFVLAVDRPYKDSDGNSPCDFIEVVAWDKLAKLASDYIKKDAIVLINGRLQCRSYESEGVTRWISEVIADSFNILKYPTKEKKENE
jgi:single-strand DNA-binding protein